MMSGTLATGPIACSTSAGSASVLSPNSASGPLPVAPVAPLAPVAPADDESLLSPPLPRPTMASSATMLTILIRCMLLLSTPSMSLAISDRCLVMITPPFLSPYPSPEPTTVCVVGSGLLRSRSTCSTARMIRSPDTNMPPTMTRPNTTNWSAVGSPITRIIWLSPARKKAAAQVESGLASPPVSDAPPITTAAIGPRRYGAPIVTLSVRRNDASRIPAIA